MPKFPSSAKQLWELEGRIKLFAAKSAIALSLRGNLGLKSRDILRGGEQELSGLHGPLTANR